MAAGLRPLLQRRRLTYRYDAPFHLVLRIDFLDAGGANVVGLFLQPETVERCRIYSTLWRDDLGGDPVRLAEAVAFEEAVLAEDLAVQQAYDELVLPLEHTVELHTRADRSARSSCVGCSPTWWPWPKPADDRPRPLGGAGEGRRVTAG